MGNENHYMSSGSDGETSAIEWVLLGMLFFVGAAFLVKPASVTIGVFVDFVETFPDPTTLGPYGNLLALVSMLLGGGGLVRKKL